MRSVVVLAVLMLCAGAWSVGAQSGESLVVEIQDPQGDAYDWNTHWATTATPCPRHELQDVPDPTFVCEAERQTLGDTLFTGVVPTSPALDIVGVQVYDDPQHLTAVLEVASISADGRELYDKANGLGSALSVRWDIAEDSPCHERVYLQTFPSPDAVSVLNYFYTSCAPGSDLSDPGNATCRGGCNWGVDVEIVAGTPGSIVWTVPRAYVHAREGGTPLIDVHGATARENWNTAAGPSLHGGGTVGFHGWSPFGTQNFYWVDSTARADGATTASWDGSPAVTQTHMEHAPLDVSSPRSRPDLSVLDATFREEPDALNFQATLEHIPEASEIAEDDGHIVAFDMDLANVDTRIRVGYQTEAGERRPWAAMYGTSLPPLDFELEITPGAPGTIALTLRRDQLPSMSAGAPTGTFYMFAATGEIDSVTVGQASQVSAVSSLAIYSITPVMPRYEFQYDSSPSEHIGFRLVDFEGDVDLSNAIELNAIPFDAGQYDILNVDVAPTAHDELTVGLGLPTSSSIAVPAGYDGAFHGVAFKTERGAFMAGHYILADAASGDFFCATDSVGFTEGARDPALLSERWSTIPGRLVTGEQAGGIDGASATGTTSVVMFVPTTCFGAADATELAFSEVRGVTYLFRNPTQRPAGGDAFLLDDVATEAPAVISMPPPPVEPVSAWAEPFGMSNFWDIFGVFIAVAFAAVSVFIVVKKRLRMKRYLIELEDLADMHHDHPEQYAMELVALRKRLYQDLLRNKLTEGHFVMVEERLRASLSGTRINAFGRSFYDLPAALMIRLQALLADGRFSPHDHRVLGELVRELRIPANSRNEVLGQLGLWLDQDQEVAAMWKKKRQKRHRRTRPAAS